MRSALRSFATLLLAVAVVTCVDSPVAPSTGVGPSGGRASVAFAPRFAPGAAQAVAVYDLNGFVLSQVHVVVTLNGQTLADTSVAYSTSDSSFSLALNVAANPGDEVAFSLQYLSGTTVLFSGSGNATTFPVGGNAPANSSPVVLVAVGPGAAAAHVTLSPAAGSFPATNPIPFGATVTDASNTAIAGALLSWTVSDPTIATIGATTGLLQPTGKRGTVTVSASTLSGVTGTAVIALVPPPAKLVVVSGGGQTGAAGAALAQPVVVQVQAADGIGASGQTVAFSLSGGTGTGTAAGSVSPPTLTTDANGNAQATVTLGTTAGTYTLTATSGSFTAPATETATAANVATLTLVSGSGQTDSVKQQLPSPLVVKAADSFGNPKSGVVVTWARTAGGGTPSATSTTTGADGTTSVTYTFGTAVGPETVAASAAGVASPVSFTETATTGGAATITAVLGNGQLAAIDVALGTPLTVRVVDASGNPVAGAHVTWTITNGTLPTSQATTDATGQATATVMTGPTTGPLTVTATLVSGASVQFSETVTSGLPATVKFTGNPSNVASGAAITPAVQVTVMDAGGNPVSVVSSSVTLTLTGGTSGAVLSGTLTQPTVNGVATFSNLSVNLAGTGYALVATVSGLTPAPSATFAVTGAVAGVATQIASNGGSVTGVVGVAVATPPSVIVKDANNNPVAGVAVTFAVASGGGSITGGSQTTNASGIATVGSWMLGNIVGLNTLTATSAGLTGSPLTITASSAPGAATALFFTAQPGLSVVAAAITPAAQVTARDAFGNTATSFVGTISIGLAVNPGGGFLSGTISTSATAGMATFSNLMLSQPGVGYVISASATGLTGANSAAFTVTVAGPAIIQWTNSAGGSWSAPGNWNLARAPIATDSVVIALAGTYTVILDTTFVGKSIVVGGPLVAGTQTLSISSRALSLSGVFAVSNSGSFVMVSSVLTGTGSIVNQGMLTLTNSSLTTAAVSNQGTMVLQGGTAISGTLTTTLGSSIFVEGNATCCAASAVISTGFTNNGSIIFTAINGSNGADNNVTLTVTSGTLVNSGSGTININAGSGTATRQLSAQLNNQGTVVVNTPFTLGYPTTAHTNSGTITLNATMMVTQSGGSPSFTNTGTIAVASGQALNVSGGTFTNQSGATISGLGALTLTGVTGSTFNGTITIASLALTTTVATFPNAFSTATTALSLNSSTLSGTNLTFASGSTTALNSTIANPIDIQGTLILQGTTALNGAVTAEATSVTQVEGNALCCGAFLTVANGFTNNGIIQLTAVNGSNGANNNVSMTVTSGTLVTAVGASIVALPGTGTASRTLTAALNNQGTLIVNVPLTMNAVGAAHTNSGTINLNAALTINQAGTTPSFTNSGTLTIGSGQTLTVNNGTVNYAGGSVGGTGTLTLNTATVNLSADLSDANAVLSFPNSTINGPNNLINASGQTLTLTSTTVNAPIQNQGTLIVTGTNAFNGALTTAAGSSLQVEGNAASAPGTLTVANSFTNNGTLILTTVNGSNGANNNAALTLTNGTLTNLGTFNILAGTGAGSRTLTAALNNQGTLTVSTPFTINGVNVAHANSGTINVNSALSLTQSGASPSFVNTGSVVVASAQQFIVTGGTFTEQTGSTLSGAGGIALSGVTAGPLNLGITIGSLILSNSTASLPAPNSIASTNLTLTGSTLNGPGFFTNLSSGSETITNSIINAPVDNQGTWHLQGTNAINGSITPEPGSFLLVEGNSVCCASALTVASGFTNAGTLQLTTVTGNNGGNNNAAVTVTSGVLTNASTGTISIVSGTGGVSPGRTLAAQVNNQGTFTIGTPLTYNLVNGSFVNSGTLAVNAALTLNESGGSPSFSSSGAITVASGQTFTVNNGTVTYSGGAVSGTGTLALNTLTMALNANFSNANILLTVPNTIINGPDTLANAPGQTLTLFGTTVNAALTNLGSLIATGVSTLNGGLGTTTTSSIQIEGNASCCGGSLTVANSFTNFGALTLTAINGNNGGDNNAALTLLAGTLTNAASGSITVAVGTGAGARTITAQLNNQGTFTVNAPITINGVSAAHTNSGTITVNAVLTISQTGTTPSFTNSGTGTVNVASGQLVTVNGGAFTDAVGGSLTGPGGITLNGVNPAAFNANLTIGGLGLITSTVASLGSGISTSATNVVVTNSTVNGPGTLTNGSTGSSTLTSASIFAPVHNMGFMSLQGGVAFNAAVMTDPGSTMQVAGNAALAGANVVATSGFTNNGVLQFTTVNGSNGNNDNAALTLNSGTLTNSSTGMISVVAGTSTGTPTRTLTAPLNNQGILNVNTALTINAANAAHSNSGTMNINAVLTLTQSGASPSFTNSGSMNLAASSGFLVNGGTFTYQSGTITGPGTLAFNNAPVTLAGSLNNANGATIAASGTTTIGGSGVLTNGTTGTLALGGTTVSAALVNQGTIVASGASTMSGGLTTVAGSLLEIAQVGSTGTAALSIAAPSGFVNEGTIELTNLYTSATNATLTITDSSVITNDTGALFSVLGGTTPGGTRVLNANMQNYGTLSVYQGAAGTFTVNGYLTMSGTLDLTVGGTTQGSTYDLIQVVGNPFTIYEGATLSVALVNGFTPVSGQTFTVVTSTSNSGVFGNLNLPGTMQPVYNPTSLALHIP